MSSCTKIDVLTCYIFLRREIFRLTKLMICSNLFYHKSWSYIQTYHTNRFLHQSKIIENTAHIALNGDVWNFKDCIFFYDFNLPYNFIRYGYVTNTKVKFVIVVESINSSLRDNEIRSVSNRNCSIQSHSWFIWSVSWRYLVNVKPVIWFHCAFSDVQKITQCICRHGL